MNRCDNCAHHDVVCSGMTRSDEYCELFRKKSWTASHPVLFISLLLILLAATKLLIELVR